MKIPESNKLYLILTVVIFVGGFIFWVSDLSSDPPMYYSGLGQSLSTDPPQYYHHARNSVLYGDSNPFNYDRWIVYKNSITSIVSYLWFSIVGYSLTNANMVGVILCFAALLFFIAGLHKKHKPWVLLAVALCFGINVTLLTYGRLTYLENGLMLIGALLFFVFSRWHDKIWGIILAGALASLAMLMGKLFGVLFLPALILTIIFSDDKARWKSVAITVSSFAVTSFLIIITFYGSNFTNAIGYFKEQSYGLRGVPEGLTSPWGFVEHFISYGYQNRLFYLDPDIFVFMVFGALFLILLNSSGLKLSSLTPSTRLVIFWTIIVFLGLMPLNYSPIRYSIIMIPAVIIGFFTLFETAYKQKKISFNFKKKHYLFLGLLFWFVLFHIIANFFFFNTVSKPIREITWISILVVLLPVWLFKMILDKGWIKFNTKTLTIGIILILTISIVSNGFRIRRLHYLDNNYNILEANMDMQQILSEDAVVSGPYGPILTAETKIKSFIHLFGVADIDSSLFDRYPITHIAIDESNWQQAVRDYPQLSKLLPVTSYWIRDYEIRLYNISKVFNNPDAHQYQETIYEQALSSFYSANSDSAFAFAQQFYKYYPDSKSGNILLIDLLSERKMFKEAYNILVSLAEKYPTDFFIQMQCGRFLQILGYQTKNQDLMNRATIYYERSVKVNRFKGALAQQTYLQTLQNLQKQGG